MYGITHCNEGLVVPLADSSVNNIPVKYEKMGILVNTINRRLATTIPSATEEFKKQIDDLFEAQLNKEAWEQKKTIIFAINGYDAKIKQSVCVIFKLSNDNKMFEKGFLVSIETYTKAHNYKKSYFAYTTFDFNENIISNVATSAKKEEISEDLIAALTPAVAPFYFASLLTTENYIGKPAVEYLKQHLDQFLSIAKYVDVEEAKNDVEQWLINGKVDFNAIAARARKVCLTTPTPVPTPSPLPEEEQPKEEKESDEEKEIKSLIDKAADFFEKWHKHKKSSKNRPHHRHH